MRIFIVCLVAFLFVGCAGKDGSVGGQGSRGEQGVQGDKGDQGDVGAQGQQGNAGVDATPVTVVKLCPGVTTYPSIFVELGLCMSGKLYGVYSANGGLLVEFAPGSYFSNSIGSTCNFTVGANCQVTN